MFKSAVFAALMLISLIGFAQKKLKGRYNRETKVFISADNGILVDKFSNDRAAFMIKGKDPLNHSSNRVGFIDTTGSIVVKPVYANCSKFFMGLALAEDTTRQLAVINDAGKTIIPFRHQNIFLCENGLLILVIKSGNRSDISIVDRSNHTIVPFGRYSNFATAPRKYRYGYDHHPFLPFSWEQIPFTKSVDFKKYIGVKKENKWAVINSKGEEISPPKFDWIGIFNKTAAPMMVNERYGITDSSGNELIPPVYDNASLTPDNFVLVTKNKKSGILSLNNKLLIPLNYDHLSQINSNAFLVDTGNRYGVKYGIIDQNNKTIIPLQKQFIQKFGSGYIAQRDFQDCAVFDSVGIQKTDYVPGNPLNYPIWDMNNGKGFIVYNEKKKEFIHYERVFRFGYYRNGKWGLLDSAGIEITSPLYSEIRYAMFRNAVIVKQNSKWGIINEKGKPLLQVDYDKIDRLNNDILIIERDKKSGLFGKNLKLISPVKYDRITLQSDISANQNTQPENIIASINGKWGIIDLNGHEITPFKYDEVNFKHFDMNRVQLNGKWGLVNHRGIEIIPCLYEYIEMSHPPLITVFKNASYSLINKAGVVIKPEACTAIKADWLDGKSVYVREYMGKKGIVDAAGKEILPFLYQDVIIPTSTASSKVLYVGNHGLYGAASFYGKIIVPLIYQHIELIPYVYGTERKYYLVTKEGKKGVVDDMGKQIIPCLYEELMDFNRKNIIAVKNGRYGLISWSNETVVPFTYQQISFSSKGFGFEHNGQSGLLNLDGKEIVPAIYDYIDHFYGIFTIHKGLKVGFLDSTGKVIAQPIYDNYSICGKETIQVEKDHLVGLIDYTGKVIYPCKYTYIKCADGKVVEIY